MAYSKAQIDRIGNLLVYLTEKLGPMPKTKLLKLIYIIEEESVKQSGTTFTELSYTYLPMGPVSTFVNKQIDKNRDTLGSYINIESKGSAKVISPAAAFNDDEFSDFDIQLMDSVIKNFGHLKVQELIDYTHRDGSPWERLHNQYDKNPPAQERTLDLLSLLDDESVSVDLRQTTKQEKAFLKYLTSEE